MKRLMIIALILLIAVALLGEVMPHPMMKSPVTNKESRPSERFPGAVTRAGRELPENVLVLLVQFEDREFDMVADYPDSLVHDHAFFDRYMLQLTDYLFDASHQKYLLNYTIHPQVITLDKPMGYYGSDDDTTERMPEFAKDIVESVDSVVDFNEWDSYIVFHAGAGQESDIERERPELLWSTFLSRKDLQDGLDPENDDYAGIPADGTFVTDFSICPESQWQEYFPTDNPQYIFGNLGVIATEFCYAIGLPNLSDPNIENGGSQGIGNWGIMGAGTWNALGYTPALPSAWCRYYLGWEDVVEITEDTYNLSIDYSLNKDPDNPQLYKINISEKEYFLIENRSQNPDNSSLNGYANFTFPLLEEGQQYYPLHEGQADLVPMFDFMTNRFKGCEWDFFLPGYSGGSYAPRDGSGLLIWHIDENVIENKFDLDLDMNYVNEDATHKGVDLEEADRNQNLDTSAQHAYKYGGPEDAFRSGNNDYIGLNPHNGYVTLPSAESYYGGAPFEIKDISASGTTMTFSVAFQWNLSTDYVGRNNYSALSLDIDENGINELILPSANRLTVWENDEPVFDENFSGYVESYSTYDEKNNNLLIPTQYIVPSPVAYLYKYDGTSLSNHLTAAGMRWASPVIIHAEEEDGENNYYCGFTYTSMDSSRVDILDEDLVNLLSIDLSGKIVTNMLYSDNLMAITRKGSYSLNLIDTEFGEVNVIPLAVPADSLIENIMLTGFNPESDGTELIVQGQFGFYIFKTSDYSLINYIESGVYSRAIPSLVDYDKNGIWDIAIGHADGVQIVAYNGEILNGNKYLFAATDTIKVYGGAFVQDVDSDDELEIIGNFSRNRTSMWKENGDLEIGFPVGNNNVARSYPFLHKEENKLYVYSLVDNANFNRKYIRDVDEDFNLELFNNRWFTEYNNYSRNAVEIDDNLENIYQTSDVFIDDEVFVYPNPFNATIGGELTLRVMVSKKVMTKIDVYSISGKKVHSESKILDPYMGNNNKFNIPFDKLASGVYFVRIKADGKYKEVKFALEK